MANGIVSKLIGRKTLSLGTTVGAASWLLAWTVNKLGLVDTLNIGGQTVTTGALSLNVGSETVGLGTANALGTKAMALLTAIPGGLFSAESIMALITVVIGSILLVGIGRILYGFLPLGQQRFKVAIELLYGAIIGTIIIAGLAGVGVSAVITLAVYYGIIALVIIPLLNKVKGYARLIRD